jgi:nitrate/nitrite-specific signal transduction histidine kinase
MLRRKLVMVLGSVIVLLVLTMAAAMWLLQDVLRGQNHVNTQALSAVECVDHMNSTVTLVQVELYQLQLENKRHLDSLIEQVELLGATIDQIGEHYIVQRGDEAGVYQRLRAQLPRFERHVAALATARNPELAMYHNREAVTASVDMQRDGLDLGRLVRDHARSEQANLTGRFRWIVIGLTVVFLIVINVSFIVLLRMAAMVVEPVEKLVHASRQLALGRFDTRVEVDQRDEFDELARAYNQLAEQLEAAEQRRLEMIGQVALTLNHEVNNATAIIELQLNMLARRSSGDPTQEKRLRQIHDSLTRMTDTVEALKHVRRIVLTDYVTGVKMLDLARSTEQDNAIDQPILDAVGKITR